MSRHSDERRIVTNADVPDIVKLINRRNGLVSVWDWVDCHEHVLHTVIRGPYTLEIQGDELKDKYNVLVGRDPDHLIPEPVKLRILNVNEGTHYLEMINWRYRSWGSAPHLWSLMVPQNVR